MGALDNFAFVLVSPKSSGNVGAAARALKNMGFGDLRMVAPRDYAPRAAAAMAVRQGTVRSAARRRPLADQVLAQARPQSPCVQALIFERQALKLQHLAL